MVHQRFNLRIQLQNGLRGLLNDYVAYFALDALYRGGESFTENQETINRSTPNKASQKLSDRLLP